MGRYDEITDDEFVDILGGIVAKEGANILSVPGVHESAAEHFNNEVLKLWEAEKTKTHTAVEFMLSYEDRTWDTAVLWVPNEVCAEQSHDQILAWVLSDEGPMKSAEYNKVVLWSVYNFDPEESE